VAFSEFVCACAMFFYFLGLLLEARFEGTARRDGVGGDVGVGGVTLKGMYAYGFLSAGLVPAGIFEGRGRCHVDLDWERVFIWL
jgi:hypothetical protein